MKIFEFLLLKVLHMHKSLLIFNVYNFKVT